MKGNSGRCWFPRRQRSPAIRNRRPDLGGPESKHWNRRASQILILSEQHGESEPGTVFSNGVRFRYLGLTESDPVFDPNTAYLMHGDETVTDVRWHLMWKRCPEGRSGVGCAVGLIPTAMQPADALGAAEVSTFAGHDDWRLPSIRELLSLVEYCAADVTINADVFPNATNTVIGKTASYVR